MRKMFAIVTVLFLSLFAANTLAATSANSQSNATTKSAKDSVTLYFFYSKDCPHCVAAHPFIDKLKAEYPWLKVRSFEASASPRNSQLFEKMSKSHGREPSFFPTFFVGDKMIVGYTSADSTGAEIREAVTAAHNQ